MSAVARALELIDQFYYVLIGIFVLIGSIRMYVGLRTLSFAAQMGGMNSMGTRTFYAEAVTAIGQGIVLWYFVSFVSGIGEELIGVQFEWDKPTINEGAVYLVGILVIRIIQLMGVWMCYKGVMALSDRDGGGFSPALRFFIFGLIAIYIIPFSQELGRWTGFDPVALISPANTITFSN